VVGFSSFSSSLLFSVADFYSFKSVCYAGPGF